MLKQKRIFEIKSALAVEKIQEVLQHEYPPGTIEVETVYVLKITCDRDAPPKNLIAEDVQKLLKKKGVEARVKFRKQVDIKPEVPADFKLHYYIDKGSSENQKVIPKDVESNLIYYGKVDNRNLGNIPKKTLQQYYPQLAPNAIKESDTIHVNVRRIIQEKGSDFEAIMEIANAEQEYVNVSFPRVARGLGGASGNYAIRESVIVKDLELYLEDIKSIVIESQELLEGNCFYYHHTFNRFDELYNKQLNLFNCAIGAKRICEIGFNAGHSALLMLLANPNLEFIIFDINHHKYTEPAFNYIKSKFLDAKFEYIVGDSTVEMPLWIEKNGGVRYDVVHIDGGHSKHCVDNDVKNSLKLVKAGGILIIDDTHEPYINRQVDLCLESGEFEEMDILPTQGYVHRIIRKLI